MWRCSLSCVLMLLLLYNWYQSSEQYDEAELMYFTGTAEAWQLSKRCLTNKYKSGMGHGLWGNVTVNRHISTRCNPFGQKDEIGVNSGEQFKAFSSVKNTIQISPEGPAQVVYHSIRYPLTPSVTCPIISDLSQSPQTMSLTPSVTWAQRNNLIFLSINVPDVALPEIKVRCTFIFFFLSFKFWWVARYSCNVK